VTTLDTDPGIRERFGERSFQTHRFGPRNALQVQRRPRQHL
jgi:hypothetical protein